MITCEFIGFLVSWLNLVTLKDDMKIGVQIDHKIIEMRSGHTLYLNNVENLYYKKAKIRSEKIIPDNMIEMIKLETKGI